MHLNHEDLQRYDRHIRLEGFGREGQERLYASRVLVIGAGGLGGTALYYLAAAGVGTLGIADGDEVDLSNLQRQILHTTPDIGRPKTGSALDKLKALNPRIKLQIHPAFITAETIFDILCEYDFIIDATDTLAAKFLINDACVLAGRAFCHAGVTGYRGQLLTVRPRISTCYRCIFESLPPPGLIETSAQIGVLGPLAGMFGTLQAIEAIKWIVSVGDLCTDSLLSMDALDLAPRNIAVKRNPRCPVCGVNPSITSIEPGAYQG